MEEVDTNKSGKVDFTGNSNFGYTLKDINWFLLIEFLMAASNKEILLSKAKIEQSFKIFD